MSLSNREQAVLALLDALTGLDFPPAIWDADGERVVTAEQLTWLLDNADAGVLHALAAVIKAAGQPRSPDPW